MRSLVDIYKLLIYLSGSSVMYRIMFFILTTATYSGILLRAMSVAGISDHGPPNHTQSTPC